MTEFISLDWQLVYKKAISKLQTWRSRLLSSQTENSISFSQLLQWHRRQTVLVGGSDKYTVTKQYISFVNCRGVKQKIYSTLATTDLQYKILEHETQSKLRFMELGIYWIPWVQTYIHIFLYENTLKSVYLCLDNSTLHLIGRPHSRILGSGESPIR